MHPRTWVLRVVQATFGLTVLCLFVVMIASFWLGKPSGSFWWLVFAMSPVSVSLLATMFCWAPSSRPDGLGLITVMLNLFGMIFAVSAQWLPFVIGVLTILALIVRPRGKPLIEASPPPAGWPRL
jgi:hypothetical protein